METLRNFLLSPKLWTSVAVIAGSFILWSILKHTVKRIFEKSKKVNENIINKIIGILILIIAVVTVLQINGVNVTSLIAGFGITGVVVAFAVQDVMKDLISGIYIMSDGYFSVDDIVSYGNIKEGRVVSLSMKTTKIYDVNTGNTVIISNRNISEITKVSEWLGIDVPTSYEEDFKKVKGLLNEIAEKAKKLEFVKDAKFLGTSEFAASSIDYKLLIFCEPDKKATVKRAVLGLIQYEFDENGITIPYNQLDVHVDK